MDTDSYSQGAVPTAHIPGTNIYAFSYLTDSGWPCEGTVKTGRDPLKCFVFMTVNGGPANGLILACETPGWNGQPTWDSMLNPLTFSIPSGTGTIDLHVP